MSTVLPHAGALNPKQSIALLATAIAFALVYAVFAAQVSGHNGTPYPSGLYTLSLTSPLVSSVWRAFFLMGNAAILLGAAGTLLDANGDPSLTTRVLVQTRQGAVLPLYMGVLSTCVLSPHSIWAVLVAGAFGLLSRVMERSGHVSPDAVRTLALLGAYVAILGQGMYLGFADGQGDAWLIFAQGLGWASAVALACYSERGAQGTRALRYLDATIARRFPNCN